MFEKIIKFHQFILMIVVLFMAVSCTSPKWERVEPGVSGDLPKSVQSRYLVGVGDELEVKFFYYPELSDKVVVRPDGIIKLQLIPEIVVSGLTVKELNDKLINLYSEQIKQPEISVIMRGFTGQRVFVGGEVNRPQMISLSGNMDALQAILQAGGFNNTACKSSVVVISRDNSNRPYGRVIDLEGLINGAEGVRNIFLHPYDIVVVPKTAVAKLNLFVKQFIRDALPLDASIQGTYNYSKIRY